MDLREKLATRSASYLEPGEHVEQAFMGVAGFSPWLRALGALAALLSKPRIIVVTDKAVLVIRAGRMVGTKPLDCCAPTARDADRTALGSAVDEDRAQRRGGLDPPAFQEGRRGRGRAVAAAAFLGAAFFVGAGFFVAATRLRTAGLVIAVLPRTSLSVSRPTISEYCRSE